MVSRLPVTSLAEQRDQPRAFASIEVHETPGAGARASPPIAIEGGAIGRRRGARLGPPGAAREGRRPLPEPEWF